MKILPVWILLQGSFLFGAVDGVVINATTSQPQPSVVVSLVQPSASGMQTLASVKSDANGTFKIDKDIPPGPALVQALYQGATYNAIITPGSPTTGLRVEIYDSTANPQTAKVAQEMVLIEPGGDALQITETLLVQNGTKLTYQDPARGSIRFYVPKPGEDHVQVTINAPGGMPIQRPAEKTSQAGVYKVNYPLKPGETRFDVTYSLPPAETFSGKSLNTGAPTRLVTPSTVTLSGEGVESFGQEPQTQAHIYGVSGPSYDVKIEGTGLLRPPEAAAQDEDTGQPKLEEAPARLYTRLGWVLGLAFGILALGGTLLYRRGPA